MKDRLSLTEDALRRITNSRYERLVNRAVYRMRRIPDGGAAREDSGLKNLWDHWKMEMQDQHCVLHGIIRDLVEGVVRDIVDELPKDEGWLLTLATEWDDEEDEIWFDTDAVARELMSRLSGRACDEPHRREVQERLDRLALARWQEDQLPHQPH